VDLLCYDGQHHETGMTQYHGLTSSASAAFGWQTSQNPTVTGFVDGEVLTVVITDINGCTSSETTTVTVYPEPTATASNSGPVCYDVTSITSK
jgi:hypothetical protein